MVTLALVCAEGDYIDLCCIVSQQSMRCVHVPVSVQVYLHIRVCLDGCISTQVSQNLSLSRQISQRFEKMSLLLHQINLFARGIHGNWKRFEVSRKFRRDGKKDFVLPRKYSFHQLKMTERISEWLRSRVPHEQPRLRPFRHTPLWHSCS